MNFLQGIFSRIKSWFAEIWEHTEKRDRTRFLVISGIAVGLIIAAMVMLNNGRYEPLISDATTSQMSSAATALSGGDVRYKTSGNSIMVHKNDIIEARSLIAVAAATNVDFDYDLYEKATGITSTADDRRAYNRYQIEANLKITLEAMPSIDTATVIIREPPGRSFFANEEQPITAAVTLFLNSEVDRRMVETIESIVSRASGAKTDDITIQDQYANYLNRRYDDDIQYALVNNYNYQKRVETDLGRSVGMMLDRLYGPGNSIVAVSADINFDERSSESVEFIPVVDDEGVMRSITTTTEFARGTNMPQGFPGTDENGLGLDADEYAEVLEQAASEYRKAHEVINYEISQINEYLKETPGKLNGLTVSVTINADELEESDQNTAVIQGLVAASVGLRPEDYNGNVVVSYMPLLGNRIDAEELERLRAEEQRERLMELIRLLVLYLVIGLCIIVLILRTFIFLKPKALEMPEELFAGELGLDYDDLLAAEQANQELEVTKTPSRERVEEFIDANPEAVASMLRNWLQDEPTRGW